MTEGTEEQPNTGKGRRKIQFEEGTRVTRQSKKDNPCVWRQEAANKGQLQD